MFHKNLQYEISQKNSPVGAQFAHADRLLDEAFKCLSQLMPKRLKMDLNS